MNGAVVGYSPNNNFGSPYLPIKTSDVWSPPSYLLWEPNENALKNGAPIGAFEYNDGADYPISRRGHRPAHSKSGGNAAALDGHVDFVTTPQFTQYEYHWSRAWTGGKARIILGIISMPMDIEF